MQGDDLFDPRQINWQLLATGMFARLLKWQLQLLTLTFGFDIGAADPRLQLQQFQLVVAYMEVPAGMTAPLGTTTTPSRM